MNFILDRGNNGKALFVTPEGKTKELDPTLFEELGEDNEDHFLLHGLITKLQIDKYHEFIRSVSSVGNGNSKRISSFPIPDKKITENDLIPHIIDILREHGGKARKAVVDEEIYKKLRKIFEQP